KALACDLKFVGGHGFGLALSPNHRPYCSPFLDLVVVNRNLLADNICFNDEIDKKPYHFRLWLYGCRETHHHPVIWASVRYNFHTVHKGKSLLSAFPVRIEVVTSL